MPRGIITGELVAAAAARLRAAAVAEPQLSAEHIMAGALGVESLAAVRSRKLLGLTAAQAATFAAGVRAREKRVPVQYILGEWGFRSLTLTMRPPVLIPRPETEQLVELALGCIGSRGASCGAPVTLLDVGCGTGAVALAILAESGAHVSAHACDISRSAVRLTMENAARLRLSERLTVHHCRASLLPARLCDGHGVDRRPRFQMLVSNPPYVRTADMAGLARELSYESRRALDGGKDGLRVAREVLAAARHLCTPGAVVLLELGGDGHPLALAAEAARTPAWRLEPCGVAQDMQGVTRFAKFTVLD